MLLQLSGGRQESNINSSAFHFLSKPEVPVLKDFNINEYVEVYKKKRNTLNNYDCSVMIYQAL